MNPFVLSKSESTLASRGSGPLAVSVVVPAYNAARFVGQAILSAQDQSLPPLEIIVVDDGSDDQTVAVVEREFPQVRLLTQMHRGVSAARNRGWRAARGALIAFLDADDFFLPGKLAAQVRLLESNRRLGVAHSGWLIADEQGHVIRRVTPWVYAPRLDLVTWLLWKPVLLGAMVFRREWLERIDGFAEDLPQAEDVDLVLRLACVGCRAAWARQATLVYRQHGEGTSHRGAEQVRSLSTVLDRLFARPALPHSVRRLERKARYYTALWLAWSMFEQGNPEAMEHCLEQAVPYSSRPRDLTVLEWQGEFARHLDQVARNPEVWSTVRPLFRRASGMDATSWPEAEIQLNWSLRVWHPLLAGDLATSLDGLRAAGPTSGIRAARLAQRAMLCTRTPIHAPSVAAWWDQAVREGLIPRSDRHEVALLHLVLMSQAAVRHQWKSAASALGLAVRSGAHPGAVPAWGRFAKFAISHLHKSRFHPREMQATPPRPGLDSRST
ncbi:MAG: hypothetical protein A2Z30_07850 [Chloroflexi bacterium RBG_16_64_43]|nr:MAG: hypothetical protein A2Z30_07850 [Chloroflexi bacterium RBG_16_64_43]